MKVIKDGHKVTYTAEIFENGKHVAKTFTDTWFPPVYRDGKLAAIGRFLNTARNVSYYSRLLKATGFKEV